MPRERLHTLARILLDLVYPVDCVLCEFPRYALCPQCERGLANAPDSRALLLGQSGVPLVVVSSAHSEMIRVLTRVKDAGQTELARPLGRLLRARLLPLLATAGFECVIVVAPTAPGSFVKRGFHPVGLMLRHAGLPVHPWLMSRTRARDQRGLSADERARNLRGSLVADPRARGAKVILVDDVVTTGATAMECVRALTEVGAEVVCVVALTAVPRKFPQFAVNA